MIVRLAVAGALSLSCATLAFADPPPAAAYGRLPMVIDAAISPDGAKIALAQSVDDMGLVRVLQIGGGELLTLAVGARQTLRGIDFADDNTITYTISQTFTRREASPVGVTLVVPGGLIEYYRAFAVSLDNRTPRLMLGNENNFLDGNLSHVIAPIEGDPGFARMVGFTDPDFRDRPPLGADPKLVPSRPDTVIYRVDLATGRGRVAERFEGLNVRFLMDERGRIVARTEQTATSNRWRLFSHASRWPRQLVERRNRTGSAPRLFLLPDGRAAFIETPVEGPRAVLNAIDLASGATEVLFSTPRFDVAGAVIDPWSRRLVGVRWTDDLPQQKFFDEGLAAVRAALLQRLPDRYVEIRSWSRDRTRMLVRLEHSGSGGEGGGWYLHEPADVRLQLIAADYPDVGAIGQVMAITYPARDGTPIPAVLTLPQNADAKNLPLVVLVHGGPASRDDMRFDWWAQFLASRGYAVLQPNFRGSSGYGQAWEDAGLREWGGRMQTDVEDGAVALARSGRVDSARICIVGASYGGYAALAGATLTPERFACAISVNGVADLPTMLDQEIRARGAISATADYLRQSIGDPGDDRQRILEASPLHKAAAARAPVLLLHGQEDSTVPIDQSRRMAQALERAGKTVRFVELTGDDHYLSNGATRTRMLEEVDAFLKAHLAARP